MIQLGKGFDSDWEGIHCDLCAKEIPWSETKIICGTGSSLATAYHEHCYEEMIREKENPPRRS